MRAFAIGRGAAAMAIMAVLLAAGGCATNQPASLNDQMAQRRAASKGRAPEAVRKTMEDAQRRLRDSKIAETSLHVGDAMPDFTLSDAQGRAVSLSTLRALGPVVIAFYRGGWCPYCNMELHALQQSLADFRAEGATLVAISPETQANAFETGHKDELGFPLLNDRDNALARRIGLVFKVEPELKEVYKGFGLDLAKSQGNDNWELPIPATYVVDPGGTIRYAYVDPDYTTRGEPKDILAALKKLRAGK
ncbi:MAG: Thiol-disulfide oxidoreductase ResA [Phycisphaerae bacterium]|nr:Thiol-disulfide oxidoreductase ResA [Phycisphaerae bacterium]